MIDFDFLPFLGRNNYKKILERGGFSSWRWTLVQLQSDISRRRNPMEQLERHTNLWAHADVWYVQLSGHCALPVSTLAFKNK